jgi:hypothetical protein
LAGSTEGKRTKPVQVVAKVREHLKARNLPERKRRKPWSKKKLCVEVPQQAGAALFDGPSLHPQR